MAFMNIFKQFFFISPPTLTEKNLPNQSGKVFIVTGGNTGLGFELCKILYMHNGTVYVAGRSEERCNNAIASIKKAVPDSEGKVVFLKLDLADIPTIKASADEFLSKETRLDYLCNNAGVMIPPAHMKTAQGYDLTIGTSCLGPWLFTKYLTPILKSTAAASPANSVRVSWAASLAVDMLAPSGGFRETQDGEPEIEKEAPQTRYGISKAGNLFFASEFSKRNPDAGIVSVCFNPGNLRTDLQRHVPRVMYLMGCFILYPAIYGAYTELWAGFSPELTTENNGCYVAPWGMIRPVNHELVKSQLRKEEDGTGKAKLFVDWCEKECAKHAKL